MADKLHSVIVVREAFCEHPEILIAPRPGESTLDALLRYFPDADFSFGGFDSDGRSFMYDNSSISYT